MFDSLSSYYRKIISSVAIIGYKEEDIIKRGSKTEDLSFHCLYIFPKSEQSNYNSLTYNLMFPDNKHEIKIPKFFTLTLTNQYGFHTYLYNLKFSETYKINDKLSVQVPLVISISSNKEDFEPFKEFLYAIHQLIVGTFSYNSSSVPTDLVNNYKKYELMNIFISCFTIIKPPPHSLIKMKINTEFFRDKIDELDFYYSSYCEIPCNKNDFDINMLFTILDQVIIVKLVFAILTEKQIVIRAAESFILHLVFPALLKLIFPFQWIHSYLPLVPEENLELLEKPGSYLFGVLSSSITVDTLLKEYPGIVLVDCDTNEIYDLEFYSPPEQGEGLVQGTNTIVIDRSQILLEKKKGQNTGKHLNPSSYGNKGNLIIDCHNDNLLIDKSSLYLSEEEWKDIRKKIQILKNPELYEVENFIEKKKRSSTLNFGSQSMSTNILSKRSFSYNIQSMFLKLFLSKMQLKESEFMKTFIQTNLYKIYIDPKKYQNDCGNVIVNNIFNTRPERSFLNSMEVSYTFPDFPYEKLLEKFTNDQDTSGGAVEIKKTLVDYGKMKGIINEEDGNAFDKPRYTVGIGLPKNNLATNLGKGHVKNNTSILAQSRGVKEKFLQSKNGERNEFLFYTRKGFIYFSSLLDSVLQEKKIDLFKDLFFSRMISEIVEILKVEHTVEKPDYQLEKPLEISYPIQKTSSKNVASKHMGMIAENDEEENAEAEGNEEEFRGSVVIAQGSGEDLESFLEGPENKEEVFSDKIFHFDNTGATQSDNKYYESDEDEDEDEENAEITQKNRINRKLQYYLYLATLLEEIKSDQATLDMFYERFRTKIDVNNYILNFYKAAYEVGFLKDFPLYNFYRFLQSLSAYDLGKFNIDKKYKELREIYKSVLKSKEEKAKKSRTSEQESPDIKKSKTTIERSSKNSLSLSQGSIGDIRHSNNSEIRVESEKSKPRTEVDDLKPIEDFKPKRKGFEFIKEVVVINRDLEAICVPHSYNIITQCANIILSLFPKEDQMAKLSPEEVFSIICVQMRMGSIIELVAQLKKLNLDQIVKVNVDQKASFWLNCFNFLIIFAIGYKGWMLEGENDWKMFFKNVKFDLGGREFSFNDMQYILFGKVLFFPTGYKEKSDIKDFALNLPVQNLKLDEEDPQEKDRLQLNYFCISIPTKDFFGPQIFNEDDIGCDVLLKRTQYMLEFLKIENQVVYIPDFIKRVDSRFLNHIERYEKFLDKDLYRVIKEKRYSKYEVKHPNWELSFENFWKKKATPKAGEEAKKDC